MWWHILVNPSTWEARAKESPHTQGQPGILSRILSQKAKQKKEKEKSGFY